MGSRLIGSDLGVWHQSWTDYGQSGSNPQVLVNAVIGEVKSAGIGLRQMLIGGLTTQEGKAFNMRILPPATVATQYGYQRLRLI